MNFNGQVKIIGGTFKTFYELIIAAIAARTYTNADEKTRVISMWRAPAAIIRSMKSQGGNFYTVDAWKGNVNGVITQADWAAGDFTASPGGGQLFDGGIEYGEFAVPLMNRVVYAANDTVIDLDITIGGPLGQND